MFFSGLCICRRVWELEHILCRKKNSKITNDVSEQVCREKWFPSHAHFLLLKPRRKIQNLRILKNCTAGSKNKATVGVRFVSISKWRRSKFWNQAVWILLTGFFLAFADKIRYPCHFFSLLLLRSPYFDSSTPDCHRIISGSNTK